MKPTKEKTMEAIYLQSMTDFVLKIDGIVKQPEDQDTDDWSLSCFSVIENYANFLKQPLKLGFFVPCDENGNVLDPSDAFRSCEKGFLYGKAKERVLFKGFEVKSSKIHEDREFIGWEIYNPSIFINIGNGWQKPEFPDFEIIEDLLSFSKEVKLTDSAIKQIGL